VWQIFSDNEWVIMPNVLRRLMCRVLAKYNAGREREREKERERERERER
jgi:hypothetical protein